MQVRRSVIILVLSIVIGFSASSCQPDQGTNTETAPPAVVTSPATSTQPSEIQPTETELPTSSAQATCFETYLAPIAFTPDNSLILVRAATGVQIYNLEDSEEERFLDSPAPLDRPTVALSTDGETLAWAIEDNSIQLVRVSDGEVLQTLVGHTAPITKLRFAQAGERLYSASQDGWVRVWTTSGEPVHAFQPGGGEVLGIGVSPDGTRLATIPFDGPVRLWDTEDFQLLGEPGGTGGYETSDAGFSMDGHFLAADLAAGLSVWDAGDQTLLWDGVNSMAFAFSPVESMLAYSDIGEDNAIVLSSPDGKQELRRLEGHQAPVFELVFSPDGSLLASADDLEIRIWRVEDGALLYVGKSDCP